MSTLKSALPRRRLYAPIRPVDGLGVVGHVALVLSLLFAVLAVFGPLLTPHDPNLVNLAQSYAGASLAHPLGCDEEGRDILSRLIVGTRTSLLGPLAIVVLSTLGGVLVGLTAAWRGGWLDSVIAGLTNTALAFPGLLLAVTAVAVFGPGLPAAVIALGIAYTPYMARIARSAAVRELARDYVAALRVQGCSASQIGARHIVPNIAPLVVGQATLALAWATIDLAGLSYLGLGVQPPTADWGVMTAEGQSGILDGHPMESLSAGLAIIIAVCAFGLLGQRLLQRAEARAG
jgi:peptide/nickel transport system permease protein